jgi:hypothetical protein
MKEMENGSSFNKFQNEQFHRPIEEDFRSFSESSKILFDKADFFNFDFESQEKDFFMC